MPDMTIEQVTDNVVEALIRSGKFPIDKLMDSESGKAWQARAVTAAVAEVETKLRSEIIAERELRTASEKNAATLLEKFQRREQYDRDYGFHRGADGISIKPNMSRDAADQLVVLFRALKAKDMTAARAVSSGVAAEGGVLLTEDIAHEVLRLIPEYGLYPQIARPFPMTTSKLNIGAVMTDMHAYWIGENTPATPSFPGFDKVQLEAKKLGAFIPVPLEWLEDAVIDAGQLVGDLIRECIGKEIDRVGLVGKSAAQGGTDPFDGLLWSPGINVLAMKDGETSMNKFNPDYVSDLLDSIPEGADTDDTLLFNKTVFSYLRKQKDQDGNYIFQRPTDGESGSIWDAPYRKTNRMPRMPRTKTPAPNTRFVLAGDWKKYALFGMRKELAIATSDVAGEAFQNYQMAVRGITRVAIASFGPAFSVLATAPR